MSSGLWVMLRGVLKFVSNRLACFLFRVFLLSDVPFSFVFLLELLSAKAADFSAVLCALFLTGLVWVDSSPSAPTRQVTGLPGHRAAASARWRVLTTLTPCSAAGTPAPRGHRCLRDGGPSSLLCPAWHSWVLLLTLFP